MFNVTATASNIVTAGDTTDYLTIIVTNADCRPPEVMIKDNATQNTAPRPFFRSEQISISSSASLNCSGVLTTKKRWTLHSALVDPDSKTEELTGLDLAAIAPDTVETATLVIPPLSLEYGVYKIRFFSRWVKKEVGLKTEYSILLASEILHARMWDEDDADPMLTHLLPFERDAFTYIEIIPTPLVAALFESPMGYVTRGKGQTLTLEPYKYSVVCCRRHE